LQESQSCQFVQLLIQLATSPFDCPEYFRRNCLMMPLICNAILFDLDGTLIDSKASIEAAARVWCAEHDLDFNDFVQKGHGRRSIDCIRLFMPHLDAFLETEKLEELECSHVGGLAALDGAHEIIDALPSDCWAIVTSGGNRVARHRISYAGIKAPRVLVTADDVAEGKPHPEGYMKAADTLGIKYADCLVIEDAPAGIQAARAAGMKVLAVTTTHLASELTEADYRVDDLRQIKIGVGASLEITML
jgi:mannitol-1-/sugar-/sorbitol-6-phosphatase